jgi:O-antigen/teichoic acid export membrane protein
LSGSQLGAEVVLGQWSALGRARPMAIFFLGPTLLQTIAVLVLYALGHLSAMTATVAMLVTYLAGIAFRLARAPKNPNQVRPEAGEVISRQGYAWWPGVLAAMCLSRLDIIFLTANLNARLLGIYAVASTAGLLTQPILPALQSRILSSVLSPDPLPYKRLHRKLISWASVAILLIAAIGWLLVPLVFGKPYSGSRPIFVLLCVSSIGVLSVNMTSQALGAVGAAPAARRETLRILPVGVALLLACKLFLPSGWLGVSTASAMLLLHLGLAGCLLRSLRAHRSGPPVSPRHGVNAPSLDS